MVVISIDLKSFYASAEAADRNYDPLTTNLVVADASRTEKTICLAVSPSLKAYGIPGRARLFEVIQRVRQVNAERLRRAIQLGVAVADPRTGRKGFTSSSVNAEALAADPSLELDYIIAPPRMKLYEKISTQIFSIYKKYVSAEDIHVYSIDEVFMDVTGYLSTYKMTAHELAITMIREVLSATGITATAGIGTNLYLAKVAMDIVAKHVPADQDGVRIAELTEETYRELLWCHTPLSDFWRVGKGIAKRMEALGCFTMGDIARLSVQNEDILYRTLGINAELLIDHAWGWEPTEISTIKKYKPETNSLSSGQVLPEPYDFEHGRLIVREMTELLVLDLVRKGLVTKKIELTINYDRTSLSKCSSGSSSPGNSSPSSSTSGKCSPGSSSSGSSSPGNSSPSSSMSGTSSPSSSSPGSSSPGNSSPSSSTSGAWFITKTGKKYSGEITSDYYGRPGPKHAHGTGNIDRWTSSTRRIQAVMMDLYDRIVDPDLLIRRVTVVAVDLIPEEEIPAGEPEQLSFFVDYEARDRQRAAEDAADEREKRLQKATLELQSKFGKNAVLKGMNLEEGGTTVLRNQQIGGHAAGEKLYTEKTYEQRNKRK